MLDLLKINLTELFKIADETLQEQIDKGHWVGADSAGLDDDEATPLDDWADSLVCEYSEAPVGLNQGYWDKLRNKTEEEQMQIALAWKVRFREAAAFKAGRQYQLGLSAKSNL